MIYANISAHEQDKVLMAEDTHTIQPDRWLEEHGDILYRYAYVRLRDHGAAEDLVQDTFVAAMKARERYAGRSSERSWLVGILRHKIIDYLRKASREIKLDDMDTGGTENSFIVREMGFAEWRPPKWQFNPRKAFEQKEFWGVFTHCLEALDRRLHTAFVLKEMEGVSTKEICQELEVEPTYLWVILYRARKQLKTCLEKNWLQKISGKRNA